VRFDLGEDGCAGSDSIGMFAERAGEGDEDAADLALLFVEEALQFIVLLDGFERFHKNRLAGGGRSVDDAGDAATELGFDGDDEALAANGDELVLGGTFGRERAEGLAQALFNGAMLALHRAADAAELVAGVVGERAVGEDFAAEGLQQRGEVVLQDGRGELGDRGEVCGAGAVCIVAAKKRASSGVAASALPISRAARISVLRTPLTS